MADKLTLNEEGRNVSDRNKKAIKSKKLNHQIVQNDGSEIFAFYGLVRV